MTSPVLRALGSCALAMGIAGLAGCSDWTMFRGDSQRTGYKSDAGAFSDPTKVPSMHQVWRFKPAVNPQAFRASPVVFFSKVLIGNGNGYFYALDAQHGTLLWQFPAANQPALRWQFEFACGNRSSFGIASSATAQLNGLTPTVILGAPDQSIGTHLGDGRLFSLNANNGNLLWASGSLAQLTGLSPGATNEKHEHLGYSSPLVENGRVYVGVADTCDNPIQAGRIASVNFGDGTPNGFSFANGLRPGNASPPGGDVWGSVSADAGALYATSGNTRRGADPEPSPDYGLSMLRLDETSGAVQWQHQPVPYALDADPDWSATPTIMHASCGNMVVSTMKDGWTWAVDRDAAASAHPNPRWLFPADDPNWIHGFTPGDGTVHGDTDYNKPGAAWGDVYVAMDGGEDTVDNINVGFGHLHALNVCADDAHRIRWIASVPGATYFGPPVISQGLVFVGTGNGHLVVLADPSVVPATQYICAKTTVSNANCSAAGFQLVPQPQIVADVPLDGAVLTEPVLAEKNLYVATDGGSVYMFDP